MRNNGVALKVAVLGTVVFAVAFLTRQTFFAEVLPLATRENATLPLQMAFLLKALENVAILCTVLSLMFFVAQQVSQRLAPRRLHCGKLQGPHR